MNAFFDLDFSTQVNIVLGILSFILACISTVTIVVTIRQNSRILEASSRPYISIYIDSITICEQQSYLILKNFGNSSAVIKKFYCSPVLKEIAEACDATRDQYNYVEGILLSPNQSKMFLYNVKLLPPDTHQLNFDIWYQCGKKLYKDKFSMDPRNYSHIPVSRPSSNVSDDNMRQVQTLREILERLI